MTLVLFGAGLYMFEPFLRRGAVAFGDDYAETPLQGLLSQKDTIYSALKDLEFDYQTGKLSDDDYEELRKKFTGEASTVLGEIDALRSSKEGRSKSGKKGRKNKTSATAVAVQVEVQEEYACDKCGLAYKDGAKFCEDCGADLASEAAAELTCDKCGFAHNEDDKFCQSCGADLV